MSQPKIVLTRAHMLMLLHIRMGLPAMMRYAMAGGRDQGTATERELYERGLIASYYELPLSLRRKATVGGWGLTDMGWVAYKTYRNVLLEKAPPKGTACKHPPRDPHHPNGGDHA